MDVYNRTNERKPFFFPYIFTCHPFDHDQPRTGRREKEREREMEKEREVGREGERERERERERGKVHLTGKESELNY
jgi:hypothetical protein